MPIVFVHGVNNRKEDAGYRARQLLIQRYAKQHLTGIVVNGKTLTSADIEFPYWGDLATTFAWKMASVPPMKSGADALGSTDADMRDVVATIRDRLGDLAPGKDNPLAAVASASLSDAVELISEILLSLPEAGEADEIASFVAAAQSYVEQNPVPPWLKPGLSDDQLLAELLHAVQSTSGADALGNPFKKIGNLLSAAAEKVKAAVKKAVGAAANAAGDYASTRLLAAARMGLNGNLGRFFGDVFIYLNSRGEKNAPGTIPRRLMPSYAPKPNEPLVIIGHSLGGVISYDLLTHFLPDVEVDLLVTVGSQVSHFEEMKLFHVSDPKVPNDAVQRVEKPKNVRHWINIFDPVDIFSYRCDPVFAGVKDYDYDTRTYVIKAHSAYLDQNRFYVRLRDRVNQLPK